ncbi:hypothetical protein ACLBWT_10135 [Paenibacillus sp. D51F]
MDKLIEELEELTRDCLPALNSNGYVELYDFVQKRGQLVEQLVEAAARRNPSEEEKQRVKQLLGLDPDFQGAIQSRLDEASEWLAQRNRAKVQLNAYENPYDADAILMDKKR